MTEPKITPIDSNISHHVLDAVENLDLNPTLKVLAGREAKIRHRYEALGGAQALGGLVEKVPGLMWRTNGSALCYDEESGAVFHIYGAILQKWKELGKLAFGVPVTDELSTPDGEGRYNHFSGNKSIYYHPASGAHGIWGAIRKHWANLGWERSYLGYPTSSEENFAGGGRANDFQHGGIYWWSDTGAIDLRDVVVHYTGLHCFGETDFDLLSDSDEPYVIFALGTRWNSWAVRTRVYDDVDAGEQRPDLIELFRGRPYGLNIGVTLMEENFGDPEKIRKKIHDAVHEAHKIGIGSMKGIPFVGPIVAEKLEPALGQLVPTLANWITSLIGDRYLGVTNITLSGRDLVLLAARTNDSTFEKIQFKRESELLSRYGASYKVFFGFAPV